TEDRLRRRQESTEYVVANILARSSDFSVSRPQLLAAICDWLEWDTGILWTVNPAAKDLQFMTTWHRSGVEPLQTEAILRELRFPPGRGLAGRVWESRSDLWISDVTDDTNIRLDANAQLG